MKPDKEKTNHCNMLIHTRGFDGSGALYCVNEKPCKVHDESHSDHISHKALPKCGTDGKTMWCYCGKCKQEDYPLPVDLGNHISQPPKKVCLCPIKYCKHYESDFDRYVKDNPHPNDAENSNVQKWEETERETWEKNVRMLGFTESTDRIAAKLNHEIFDYWLARLKLVREESYLEADSFYRKHKDKWDTETRTIVLEEVREKLEEIAEEPPLESNERRRGFHEAITSALSSLQDLKDKK